MKSEADLVFVAQLFPGDFFVVDKGMIGTVQILDVIFHASFLFGI